MKTRFLAVVGLVCLLGLSTGCYHTVDGRSKMGVPFKKDRIESRYERPPAELFVAARKVLEFNGTLTAENTVSHTLESKVDKNTVYVKIDEVDAGITRVLTQVRSKGGGANIDLASEIDKQIALQIQAR